MATLIHHHQPNRKDDREPVIDPALSEPNMSRLSPIPNSHSPSPSLDRSTNSTPHLRRPSPTMPSYPYYDRYRSQDHHHHSSGYLYAPPFDPRYDHHYPHHLPPPDASGHHYSPAGLPTHYIPTPLSHPPPPIQQSAPPPSPYPHHYGPVPGQPTLQIVHTSDANTKLTDGIRRRCFNCCTTDTSTWRRSNLSPGKVLCNKCGLFERTHSRPRPEQFPHKRGALASSNLRGRTPPGGPSPQNQLPSLAAATAPYQYHHTPLTPLNAPPGDYIQHMHHPHHPPPHPHANTLPGLQSWHNSSISSVSSAGSGPPPPPPPPPPTNTNTNGQVTNSNGATEPPPLLNRRSGQAAGAGGGGGGGADSPRMQSGASTPVSSGRLPFEDRLASNAVVAAVDPHLRSHPPSPRLSLSRSSNHQTESHTPPTPRDPQA